MILTYMLENGIAMDKDSTMIRGNCVYTLGLITKKGGVVIKDLTKFLVGSLDYNCKSFRIPREEAKTSFEHEKCKTWEEVEKHKVKKDLPPRGRT